MKAAALAILATMVVSTGAMAQEKDRAVVVQEVEGVVTVVEVDQEARTVVLKGPNGNLVDMAVPPEAQNLDQVHPGSRFNVRYLQSVAVAITKGRAASSSAGRTAKLAAKGDTPGGVIVNTRQITGVIESLDLSSRMLSVRGPEGRLLVTTIDEEVEGLESLEVGDAITVEYTESLAMRMISK